MSVSRRLAIVLAGGILVLSASVPTSVGAAADPPPITVNPASVAPGGALTVTGSGCGGGSTVLVGVLDAGGASELAAVAGQSGGAAGWSVKLTLPADVRPGTYPVTARCSSYAGGYDGYDGYSGGGFEYAPGTVAVDPPVSAPEKLDGSLTVDPSTVAAGGTVKVTSSGWQPGEQVTVVLYSTPVTLATVRAGADGRLDVTVAIPGATPPGAHQIVEFNATSATALARTLGGPLQVTAATPGSESVVPISAPTQNADVAGSVESSSGSGSMAYTGTEPVLLIVVGASILILGAVLLLLQRRRPIDS